MILLIKRHFIKDGCVMAGQKGLYILSKHGTCPHKKWELTPLIFVCFFLSGACGLIYEVVWTRIAILILGNTVFAVSTVLSVFMGGLALGSLIFGRLVDRLEEKKPSKGCSISLFLYAVIEAGIGLYCFFTPFLFEKFGFIYLFLSGLFPDSFFLSMLFRFLFCFLILIIPTSLMGATLPVISKFFIREFKKVGEGVGILYALNTFGAVAGTFIAGFIALPLIGVKLTIFSAAAINLAAGIVAYVIGMRLRETKEVSITPIARPSSGSNTLTDKKWKKWELTLLIGFFVAGLVSMIYEICWMRILCLIIGSSVYAFSTMLITFLAGIALGSFLFGRFKGRREVDLNLFGALEIAIGFIVILTFPIFSLLPYFLARFSSNFTSSYIFFLAIEFIFSFMVMILPTLLMGMAFPVVSQIYTRNFSHIGFSLAKVYSSNTFGCILGSVLAGFLFIPFLGLQNSIILGATLNVLIGCFLILTSAKRKFLPKFFRAGTSLFFFSLILLYLPPMDKEIISEGIFLYKNKNEGSFSRLSFISGIKQSKQLKFYKEGINSTISVHLFPPCTLSLKVNGKADASNGQSDMLNQLLAGYLPCFFHPNPKDVLVIGLGSGVTLGAVCELAEVKKADCVEIEPAVKEAASFFSKENHNVLKNPKASIFINDGRNFLLASPRKYDVIICEPSNPWMAGINNLFTLDFYNLCKEKLNPQGIICQWVHLYAMSLSDIKTVINTFGSVFPDCSIWSTNTGDILLIASKKNFKIDYNLIKKRFLENPVIKKDMAIIGIERPYSIFSSFVLGEEETTKLLAGFSLKNTDDFPIIEFSAPKSLYAATEKSNLSSIRGYKKSDFPSNLINFCSAKENNFNYFMGLAFLSKTMCGKAVEEFKKEVLQNPLYIPAYINMGQAYLFQGKLNEAREIIEKAINIEPENSTLFYLLGNIYFKKNDFHKSAYYYQKVLSSNPDVEEVRLSLAESLMKNCNYRSAIQFLEKASYKNMDTLEKKAFCLSKLGRFEESTAIYERIIKERPFKSDMYLSLANSYFLQGKYRKAIENYRKAIKLDRGNIDAHLALGVSLYYEKDFKGALKETKEVLRLNPFNKTARDNLNMIREEALSR